MSYSYSLMPKNKKDKKQTDKVRNYIKSINGFKKKKNCIEKKKFWFSIKYYLMVYLKC